MTGKELAEFILTLPEEDQDKQVYYPDGEYNGSTTLVHSVLVTDTRGWLSNISLKLILAR